MKYDNYKFIYPPRPEHKISALQLGDYADGFVAQPKFNGDCCCAFIHPQELVVRNRENEPKDHVDRSIDLHSIARKSNGWIVIAGEMLDKAKLDEYGEKLKGFVIWDILVYNGRYLVGSTFAERLDLLDNLFPPSRMSVTQSGIKEYRHLLFTEFNGVYRTPSYQNNFADLYNDLILTDLYEGIVLKKMGSKLETGFNPINNARWQLKVRKAAKNYRF